MDTQPDVSATKFERGAASSLWSRTLAQIPTVFGRLQYLASLRNPNTGRYVHHGMAQFFGEQETDAALRASHQQVFAEWLSLPLARQKADFDGYLSELEGDRKTILTAWLTLEPYRNLPPVGVREVEKQLYLAEIEALLALLRNESGVAAPAPEA